MIRALILCLALFPGPATADPPGTSTVLGPPLTASQFASYASGKTLTYASGGVVWGTEHYLPFRQVLWAFTDQPCEFGHWFAQDDAICFVYDGNPKPNCWLFHHGTRGLIARFLGGSNTLSEVGQTAEPMTCPDPKIGA